MHIRKILCLALSIIVTGSLFAVDTVTVSQIDTSDLLLKQEVGLYLSVTDARGFSVDGLTEEMFRVFESSDGVSFRERPKTGRFRAGANQIEGIHFLLLVDNSGSMYDTIEGKKSQSESEMRITHAKGAIRTFVNSIDSPKDRMALVSFNTRYVLHSQPSADKMQIASLLDEIERPGPEDAYTELYASLTLAAEQMSLIRGRKALIVLSDGENYPFFAHTGKEHVRFKERIYEYTDPIETCQKEGISIFAINFGREKDKNLQIIAGETGGAVFDARNQNELSQVYQRIRDRILREYLLSYRASMDPADKRYVKVELLKDGSAESAARVYYSSTVFGLPLDSLHWLLIVPFLAALLLWWLLSRIKPPKKRDKPSLELLASDQGKVSTKLFSIEGKNTVIGGSERADLTIAGAPAVKEKHATVMFDNKTGSYTLVSDGSVTVNNKTVSRKKLEAGDVINVGGTTLVFDDDVLKKK